MVAPLLHPLHQNRRRPLTMLGKRIGQRHPGCPTTWGFAPKSAGGGESLPVRPCEFESVW